MTDSLLLETVEVFGLDEHRKRLLDRQRDAALGLVVMVVGEGNFGKSSLVNALCGRAVAPVAVIPKTFKIDVYTAGNSDRALVRRLGESTLEPCSHAEAASISAAAEAAMRSRSGSDLAEILWEFQGLGLQQGIALVDTPGISQALAGSAKGITLTQVLGSSFEVDQVWAHWFHRADVVIWGFCANKMQSAETQAALEGSLRLFDKRIIPVATKADVISRDRWPEIHDQFNRIYASQLHGRLCAPLHLTVCGGKDASLSGHGIAELRATLDGLLGEATHLKRQVHQQFVRDEATTISKILEVTATELVANLRSIASLGDRLADEAQKEADRATHRAVSAIDTYLRSLRQGSAVLEMAQAIHLRTSGGRQGDIGSECRIGLVKLVNSALVQQYVDEAFTGAGSALETMAARLAAGADVGRVTFKSSGDIIRKSVTLRLELRAVRLATSLPYVVRFNYPKGFLAGVWDFIKGLFGADRFSVQDIQNALAGALSVSTDDLRSSRDMAVFRGYAPAIRDAVNEAIDIHLKEADSEAITQLNHVDIHLPRLKGFEGDRATTYGPQGEYWATISPRTETLLNLAREELTCILPEFRRAVGENFKYLTPRKFPIPSVPWAQRSVAPDPAHRNWRFLPRAVTLSVSFKLCNFIKCLGCLEAYQAAGKTMYRDIKFRSHLSSQHHLMLKEHPLVLHLDARLAEATVGVRYRSAGDRLAELGSSSFERALDSSRRRWDWSLAVTHFCGLNIARGFLPVAACCLVIGLALALWLPLVSLAVFLVGLAIFGVGVTVPYAAFTVAYRSQLARAVHSEIKSCQQEAETLVPSNTVDLVVNGMTAELAPRPLQALLLEAGLLRN